MTKILCIIPSRLHSTRLPRKPLVLIKDKPMVQWVYEAACACSDIDKVIVATDSDEVGDIIKKIDGHVEMTSSQLQTGSDRVAFVAKKFPQYSVVVNLQGDQPFVTPDMLSALIAPYLRGETIPMTTLGAPIDFDADYNNPNTVKVIFDKNHDALYFSRSPIPFFRDASECLLYKREAHSQATSNDAASSFPMNIFPIAMHLGLYAYQRDFLLKYNEFEQTPLEKAESLEQLRALENGYKIRVCFTDKRTIEINTQEDLINARNY